MKKEATVNFVELCLELMKDKMCHWLRISYRLTATLLLEIGMKASNPD